MTSRPAAVLVDADGVLQTNPLGWLDEVRSFVPEPHAERFVADLFASEQEAMTGSRRFEDVVAEVTRRWGVAERADELIDHYRRIEVCADTAEVVAELRAGGVACHLATNQNELRAAYMLGDLGYADLLDGTFSSCDLGVTKSEPAFFTRVVRELRLEPQRVLHVDDKQEYADSARAAGLRAVVWSVDDGPRRLRAMLREHDLPVRS